MDRVLDPYVDIVSTTFDGQLPVDAIAFSLPGMFAILAVGLAGLVIALGTALTAAPLVWVLTAVFLFFASFPADTVREAEQLKTRDVQTTADIDSAAHVLAQWSRRVFGPRLVVLRVASNIWRQTVSRMASVSSVALIDVSEPTGNLIWRSKSSHDDHKRNASSSVATIALSKSPLLLRPSPRRLLTTTWAACWRWKRSSCTRRIIRDKAVRKRPSRHPPVALRVTSRTGPD